MKHPIEVKRDFTIPDEEVIEKSDLQMNAFLANEEAFVARFPELGNPFAADWAEATNKARGFIPDFASLNEQVNETQSLETVMEQGRTHFQTIMLYAQLAFPENTAVMRLFGQLQYKPARHSPLKMPVLLRNTFNQISKAEYLPALLEKGLKEEDLDLLKSLADEIVAQNLAQQKAKKARTLAANDRILAMNEVWSKMAKVCQCAKLVFQNDAARYNLFLLTDSEVPKKEEAPAPAV